MRHMKRAHHITTGLAVTGLLALCLAGASALSHDTRTGHQPVRVFVSIEANSLARAASSPKVTADLQGLDASSSTAALLARRSPFRVTAAERHIARRAELRREVALRSLQPAVDRDAAAAKAVARHIEALGGRIEDYSVAPAGVTVTIADSRLDAVRSIDGVDRVEASPAPRPAFADIYNGATTWHSAGYTGAGAADSGPDAVDSPDGHGGPDVAIDDTGIRPSHVAFAGKVISPSGRTSFTGSKHGNGVAAAVGSEDGSHLGIAYGVEKLLDPREAKSGYGWITGFTYDGEAGAADPAEIVNQSWGVEPFTDDDYTTRLDDLLVANFGISVTPAAGNCGVANTIDCVGPTTPVGAPANTYNGITVGGYVPAVLPANDAMWPSSSPGPTRGGRKKPDLVAQVQCAAPSYQDDTSWFVGGSAGEGTSCAAPRVAGGVALLAGAGISSPMAQKAILINSARPVAAQTYWRFDSGWGSLDLTSAYPDRGNYVIGSVTAGSTNATRFFSQNGVANSARTTLVWNRRVSPDSWPGHPPQFTAQSLTNLDLSQLTTAGASAATGGSDAADTVENAGPFAVATDNEDNVEQTRSTTSGNTIMTVKAIGSISGAASESFALAGTEPITALETPSLSVGEGLSASEATQGTNVTVTAQVTNNSSDLSSSSVSATITLPLGVQLVSGSSTQNLGTLAPDASGNANWTVSGTADGLKALTVSATGTTYGELFGGSDSKNLTVDSTAPAALISAPGGVQASKLLGVSWSASDAGVGVSTYDVQVSRDGGSWSTIASATAATSTTYSAPQDGSYVFRVRARDALGNVSSYVASSSTAVDADLPSLTVNGPVSAYFRQRLVFTTTASNVGSGVTVEYAFNPGFIGAQPVVGDSFSYTTTPSSSTGSWTTTIYVRARDGLGRSVVKTLVVTARFASPLLRLRSVKRSGRKVVLSGTVSRRFLGYVYVYARDRRKKLKTVKATSKVVNRRWRVTLRVRRAGKYRLTAKVASRGIYASASTSRNLTVR